MPFFNFCFPIMLLTRDASELSSARIQLGSARKIFGPARLVKFGQYELNFDSHNAKSLKEAILLLLLLWALDTEVQKRVSLVGFGSHPRGVESPSTRQLELQPAWDKGGILRPVQS